MAPVPSDPFSKCRTPRYCGVRILVVSDAVMATLFGGCCEDISVSGFTAIGIGREATDEVAPNLEFLGAVEEISGPGKPRCFQFVFGS